MAGSEISGDSRTADGILISFILSCLSEMFDPLKGVKMQFMSWTRVRFLALDCPRRGAASGRCLHTLPLAQLQAPRFLALALLYLPPEAFPMDTLEVPCLHPE